MHTCFWFINVHVMTGLLFRLHVGSSQEAGPVSIRCEVCRTPELSEMKSDPVHPGTTLAELGSEPIFDMLFGPASQEGIWWLCSMGPSWVYGTYLVCVGVQVRGPYKGPMAWMVEDGARLSKSTRPVAFMRLLVTWTVV